MKCVLCVVCTVGVVSAQQLSVLGRGRGGRSECLLANGQPCHHFSAHLPAGGCAGALNQKSGCLGSDLHRPHARLQTLGPSLSLPQSVFSHLENEKVGLKDLGFSSNIDILGYSFRSLALHFSL